jgi:hypothetical protein
MEAIVRKLGCVLVLLFLTLLSGSSRATGGSLFSPVVYAATGPFIDGIAPAGGMPAAVVTITGKNFARVQQVTLEDDVVSGSKLVHLTFPMSYQVVSSKTIVATVPTIAGYSSPKAVKLAVTTASGRATARSLFDYVPPTVVPNVVGLDLRTAESEIRNAKLGFTVNGPQAPTAVVTGQMPAARATVAVSSTVTLTTAMQPNGVSSIVLYNDLSDGDPVYVWLYDGSLGTYALQNGGSLVPAGQYASSISLETGHIYMIVAVDPQWCSANDPTDSSCIHWSDWPIPGDSNGPSVVMPMN